MPQISIKLRCAETVTSKENSNRYTDYRFNFDELTVDGYDLLQENPDLLAKGLTVLVDLRTEDWFPDELALRKLCWFARLELDDLLQALGGAIAELGGASKLAKGCELRLELETDGKAKSLGLMVG